MIKRELVSTSVWDVKDLVDLSSITAFPKELPYGLPLTLPGWGPGQVHHGPEACETLEVEVGLITALLPGLSVTRMDESQKGASWDFKILVF